MPQRDISYAERSGRYRYAVRAALEDMRQAQAEIAAGQPESASRYLAWAIRNAEGALNESQEEVIEVAANKYRPSTEEVLRIIDGDDLEQLRGAA